MKNKDGLTRGGTARSFFTGPLLDAGILVGFLALVAAACGPAELATPTPTATATRAPATATPTAVPTGAPGVVATPTPTATRVAPTPAGEQPKRGGVFRYYTNRDVSTWDPHREPQSAGFQIMSPAYDSLLWNPGGDELGSQFGIECNLCTDYAFEGGGKKAVLHLRRDVKFHDGRSLTSADAVYSLNKMMGLVDGVVSVRSGPLKEYVESLEAPDPYTLVINLVRPAPDVMFLLATNPAGIMPEGTKAEDSKSKPYGSGPFRLKEWTPGIRSIYERNPDYWHKERPYLDEYQMLIISETPAQHAAFVSGQIDQVGVSLPDFYDPVDRMIREGRVVGTWRKDQISSGESSLGAPQVLMFNVSRPPFDDIRMRKAVNLAFDRKAFEQINYVGRGNPCALFCAGVPYARPKEELWKMNGWYDTPEQLKARLEEGQRLVKEYYGSPGPWPIEVMGRSDLADGPRMAEFAAEVLRRLGFAPTLRMLDTAPLTKAYLAGDYTISGNRFNMTDITADETIFKHVVTGGSRNMFHYSNPEVDRLALQQQSELDPVKRAAMVRQIEDILLAYYGPWSIPSIEGARPGVVWYSKFANTRYVMSVYTDRRFVTTWKRE